MLKPATENKNCILNYLKNHIMKKWKSTVFYANFYFYNLKYDNFLDLDT